VLLNFVSNVGKDEVLKRIRFIAKRCAPFIRTMRFLFIILAFTLFDSCTPGGPIDFTSIQIVRFNQHPWFIDHDRKLVTLDNKGEIIDELKIYPDSGAGCNSYIFDAVGRYILIDCNGQWFSIEKSTGQIKNDGWKWWKPLPSHQLGVLRRQDKEVNYKLVVEKKTSMRDVYKYKDPNE
jgi:hypothetical protein